ncbi:MAG: NAD(P)H-quinone oxidoreductase [Gammaproteobacteria bacterium AqS3]|nr:NAD(P)H-quinone oxidoreductase [Gammaproteobacteria bacterium AqS3]
MQAVVISHYGDADVLQLRRDVPIPDPAPHEVRVRTAFTALNRADVMQRQGFYPPPGKAPEYEIPGLEFAGAIDALGADVTSDWKVGDRVCGLLSAGGYAEFVTTPADLLIRTPEGLTDAAAAAIPEVFMTAWDALHNRARIQPGETALIHAGGSGVGTAAIQLAKKIGATTIATFGSPEKLDAALALGLDHGILYKEQAFEERTLELTQKRGADVILDFIGAAYLSANIKAAASLGRIVVIGLMGGASAELSLGLLLAKRLQITGTVLRARSHEEKRRLTKQVAEDVFPGLAAGELRPVIDRTFALADAAEAHRHMESNANFGKILLRI